MSKCALLSNHGLTLLALVDNHEATTREIATGLGMTERSVQRIVSDLQSAAYVRKKKVGRGNRYQVDFTVSLRHPFKSKTVGNLLSELVSR